MTDTSHMTLQEKIAHAKSLAGGEVNLEAPKVDEASTNNPPNTSKESTDTFGRPIPYPEKEGIDIPHNIPVIDPAANGNGISDPANSDKPNADAPPVSFQDSIKEVSPIPEPSIEDALAKGFRVFKKLDLHTFIRKDGNKVLPTPAGYFFAIDKELEEGLAFFAEHRDNLVEEVTK